MNMAVVAGILDTVLSPLLDPRAIVFKEADELGVKKVRSVCRRSLEQAVRLKKLINRNAFLCGCLDFTEHDEIEHIIIGFGNIHGSTTKISSIAHVSGASDRVIVPPLLDAAIMKHLQECHRGEVLIFHNHPPNVLNAVFDNLPMPSTTDRNTLLRFLLQPLLILKFLSAGGRVRLYLGENGFVREFRTPAVLTSLSSISRNRERV